MNNKKLQGTGLGLRREFVSELREILPAPVDFLEVTPESWMRVGGTLGKKFAFYADHYPLIAHGVSLSLGSPAPLDLELLDDLKVFLDQYHIHHYSEYLCYCSDHHGHLYNLLPIPFTYEAARYVAARIKIVQEKLERRIAIEPIHYYCAPGKIIEELDFINAVLDEADCDLLLDVNSVYVNSQNHQYNPHTFIEGLPSARIQYLHIAGHECLSSHLLLNTRGTNIADPTWDLLQYAYHTHGILPTVLERDIHIPPLNELLEETKLIRSFQTHAGRKLYA
jgi:uncharacterized protein (UPF0276 family)